MNLTCPIWFQRDSLKEAAVEITWGKLVAAGKAPRNFVPGPTSETPCSASDHQSYPSIPNLGIAIALFTNSLIFSCNVSRPIKSWTLKWMATFTLQNLNPLVMAFLGSHAKGVLPSLCKNKNPWRLTTNNNNDINNELLIM